MNARFVVCAAAALAIATVFATARPGSAEQAASTPAGAAAASSSPQPVPSPTPVNLPPLPSPTHVDPYTKAAIDLFTGALNRAISNIGNTASGTVSYFKHFELQLQTGASSYRNVHLHQGTIIDPRGATLAVGEHIDVSGAARPDGSLDANVITVR